MNLQTYKTKLEEEKKLLEEELSELGKLDDTGEWKATSEDELKNQEVSDDGDMAERSEDYEERSIKLKLLQSRLSDIKTAMIKIEDGGFGICENCEKKIEEDRLEVNGAAKTCKECMNKVI